MNDTAVKLIVEMLRFRTFPESVCVDLDFLNKMSVLGSIHGRSVINNIIKSEMRLRLRYNIDLTLYIPTNKFGILTQYQFLGLPLLVSISPGELEQQRHGYDGDDMSNNSSANNNNTLRVRWRSTHSVWMPAMIASRQDLNYNTYDAIQYDTEIDERQIMESRLRFVQNFRMDRLRFVWKLRIDCGLSTQLPDETIIWPARGLSCIKISTTMFDTRLALPPNRNLRSAAVYTSTTHAPCIHNRIACTLYTVGELSAEMKCVR